MDRSEQEHIAHCKRLIEEKLRFGNEQGELRQRDLEYLATIIEENSGITLSLSTLKRLWKKDYDKVPHPATLQGLVSVLGYKDWQAFKQQETVPAEMSRLPVATKPKQSGRFRPWLLLPIAGVVALVCWLIAFRSGPLNKKLVIKGPVTFTGNKTVSQGVPSTIIFNYDVSHIAADSFFFQQSWNPADRVRLDPASHVYSSIYYYPGFHRAKLIANDSVVKRFKVHITTDGWFPLVRNSFEDDRPVYLRKKTQDGAMHLTRDDLLAADVNMEKEELLSYFNIRDFNNTQSDNFSLDTRITCDSLQTVACPGFQLVIVCEENIFFVRLMGKGCERDIAVKMGEVMHDGIHKDLSILGRNMYGWQHLQVQVVNKKATIYLEGQPVYSITFRNDFGKVVGLVYNFNGTGAVDYVRLKNGGGQQVYTDEFNE